MTDAEAKLKLSDRLWRLSHLYKIKTKDMRLATFRPNPAQVAYLAEESDRDIIVKARQLGMTTLKAVELLDFSVTTPNANACLIAHERDKVQKLFEIIRLAYDKMPPELRPVAKYDNRNELSFPALNSKVFVALDTRGETIHNLHVSEVAYIERAEEKMLGILESVPKDGIISFESTANGMSGYFYDTWEDSRSEFRKHFLAWFLDPDYVERTGKTLAELIAEYEPLQLQYGLIPKIWQQCSLSPEQFAFYIGKVRRHKAKVVQEYPSTALEAFIASGRNVFHPSDLQKHQPQAPVERMYQSLMIYEKPQPGFRYTMGIDPAEGTGRDNSVIEVLNAYTGEQAAEFADNQIQPDELADYAISIGKMFNNAFMVPEVNAHGLAFVNRVKTRYANVYRREHFDKTSNSSSYSLGWKTTMVTKPILVDDLEEATRTETIHVRSEEALKEMKVFVRLEESGKHGFGAEGSKHDDRVIALGLALQGVKHLPKMATPKSDAQKRLEEYIRDQQTAHYFPNRQEQARGRKRYRIRGREAA